MDFLICGWPRWCCCVWLAVYPWCYPALVTFCIECVTATGVWTPYPSKYRNAVEVTLISDFSGLSKRPPPSFLASIPSYLRRPPYGAAYRRISAWSAVSPSRLTSVQFPWPWSTPDRLQIRLSFWMTSAYLISWISFFWMKHGLNNVTTAPSRSSSPRLFFLQLPVGIWSRWRHCYCIQGQL